MPRARNIKPGFFKNEELSDLPFGCRLLFAGLWTLADREGRLEDRPRRIGAELFPFDREAQIEEWLDLLASGDDPFIIRYSVGKDRFIAICKWHKHQTPHHMEVPSEIPAPEGLENRYNHAPVTKKARELVLKRDGYRCKKCGANESLHIDHVVAISKGGTSDIDNLQTLCSSCNLKKRNSGNNSNSSLEQIDNGSRSNRDRTDEVGSCSTDSLIPDSLIPDSGFLIPAESGASAAPLPPGDSLPSAREVIDSARKVRVIDSPPQHSLDETYQPVVELAKHFWPDWVPEDLISAHHAWRIMPHDDRQLCIANLRRRIALGQDSQFVAKTFAKYLAGTEWKRKPREPTAGVPGKLTQREQERRQALMED